MQICLACSATTPESSGRFCPECGALLTSELGASLTDPQAPPVTHGDGSGETRDVAPRAASLIGTTFDGFEIESVIGGGMFGTVYRGRQLGLDRAVAIKVPTMEIASDPISARRFAREARSAARISHPGVVSIYAVGELPDGRPYLVMQLLDGVPLDRILADGPLAIARALEIARAIASALSETHAADVVHRDLKPANIMWRRDRSGDDWITLVDFGIAVCKPSNAEATRLTSGGLIGTPHYMSPEQAHGDVVDARADIYALGCMLFELVTATTPYSGSGLEVLLAHLGRPAPRPSERNPKVPESIERLILGMMAKQPNRRIPTADAVIEMIDGLLARPSTSRAKHQVSTRKNRLVIEPAPPDPMMYGDEIASAPRKTARWIALGAVGAFALCGAGFAVLRLTVASNASSIDDRDGAEIGRRAIFRDDGETRLRVWVPEPFAIGRQRLRIELRNKLGEPIVADQLIVTIEDPDHHAIGITARPRQDNAEQFGLSYDYKTAGTYRLRVFPPEDAARSPSTFDVELAVGVR